MNMLVTKIEALKEKAGTDLSTAEDLSIAVINLIQRSGRGVAPGDEDGKRQVGRTPQ